MAMIVRAADVGSGNTKYVVGIDGEQIKCTHFRSTAYHSDKSDIGDALGGKRKTVGIPIDGLIYEVGPEVHLAADIFHARQMHDGYCETPEYLALLRGALSYMKVEKIDLLVLGLPVATFKTKRTVLERRMTGLHELAKGRCVQVERVRVVAQPQGALMHYGVAHNRLAEVKNERNLVIDPGARTFDWLVSQGMRIIEKRSHSVNRGMFDVLSVIADGISEVEGTQFRDYDRIDNALRANKKPKIFGKEYDISKHLPAAKKIAEDAVAEMLRYVGDGNDIDNIILVGGGAFFFKPIIKEAFYKHKIQELGDGLYANVKGFQIAGMELVNAHSVSGGVQEKEEIKP
ncbi:MAG: PRTRC system protein D [Pseudomonadota bacterium]